MKKLFAIFLLSASPLFFSLTATSQSCTSAVCNAASPSESDVLAALPSSSNGNSTVVVNIPSGTAAWNTGFKYSIPAAVTNLTIQGATNVNCTGTAGTSSYTCSASDATVIQDAYPSNTSLMTFVVGGSSSFFRITGLTLAGGNVGGSYPKYNGIVQILSGTTQNFRMDHNHFNDATYSPANQPVWFRTFAPIAGVADHNRIDQTSTAYPFTFAIDGAIGDNIGNADGTWANPTAWGSPTSFYIESNYMTGGVINDCGEGGAFVARYNTFVNATVAIQTHATKSTAGPARGCRMYEAYHNYIVGPTGSGALDAAVGSKNGSALIWGNTMVSGYYRFFHGCTDRNCETNNETATPSGWGYCGTTPFSNGIGSPWDGNTDLASGYPCLDGLGRGQTTQSLNGSDFPGRLNAATGSISWPQQYLEPIYLFMNSLSGPQYSQEMLISDTSSQNNRDYYFDCGALNSTCTGGFTGSAGTGYGPLSSRPTTCKAGAGGTYQKSPTGSYGVAYFATDANGGNGELYVCSSSNTWTGIYQPYTFPHPLVNGTTQTSSAPPPPTGLVGSVL